MTSRILKVGIDREQGTRTWEVWVFVQTPDCRKTVTVGPFGTPEEAVALKVEVEQGRFSL
jgi:hypothetical protein